MKLKVIQQQAKHRVHGAKVRRLTRWLLTRSHPDPKTWAEVVLTLADDDGITPVNIAVFARHRTTDVISATYQPMPGESRGHAEVFVNVERAWKIGKTPGGASRELALYIAHGCQHLTGASDHTPRLRAAMRRKERAWLREADDLGYIAGLTGGVKSTG